MPSPGMSGLGMYGEEVPWFYDGAGGRHIACRDPGRRPGSVVDGPPPGADSSSAGAPRTAASGLTN